MTENFTPPPGWREVSAEEAARTKVPTLILDGLNRKQYWVQGDPVVALPTAQYTVISAHFPRKGDALLVLVGHYWAKVGPVHGSRGGWNADVLQLEITGFDVLADPRIQGEVL